MRVTLPGAVTPTRAYRGALLAILALAAVLRVYDLGNLPPGLFCDEAALGVNARLILESGRDENRELLPLYVWSFGVSYKNPVFIYAATVPIALFGLNDFSVRLTSAFFGVLAVLGIGWLGRLMLGRVGGLLAALFLALLPWHLHFSRIAFELIAFPAFFLLAFATLVSGVRGHPRRLPVAGLLFAWCLYTYVPAKLFVPAFLAGALLVYWRRLWAEWRWTLAGVLLLILTAAPVVIFDIAHRDRAGEYISKTTTFNPAREWRENAEQFRDFYSRFFSREFLFERGDPIPRHAVGGFGELYPFMAPLLLLGVVWALWPGHPEGKLLLWWMALYPIAPSLMNEVPSASRGIIGAPGFALLAACGAAGVLATVRRLIRVPAAATALQVGAVLALLGVLGLQAQRYWRAYVTNYPAQAAEWFQYGYREAIQFMEPLRNKYDLFLMTASHVNQPQAFTAFYTDGDAQRVARGNDSGYLILDPAEYPRYRVDRPFLAAVRPSDLYLFQDFTELHQVRTPAGKLEFVIVEVRSRHRFITEWLLLGPFDNPGNAGVNIDFVTPTDIARRAYTGAGGATYWRRTAPQFVRVDFNSFYDRTMQRAGRPNDNVCGYAVTQVESTIARDVALEIGGSFGMVRAWADGQPLSAATPLGDAPRRWPMKLAAGQTEVLVKLCKGGGDWFFTARVTDQTGRDIPGLMFRPALRDRPPPEGVPEPPQQLVNGFGSVLRFEQQADRFADYRGDSPSWWATLGDADGAVVWETDPVPARAPTVFAFTAAVGDAPGEAELWVNRTYALSFPTGRTRQSQRWVRGPFVLEYQPRPAGNYQSGYWLLHVPAEQITPGKPVELRVAHREGRPYSYFMIKGRPDTIAAESLTLAAVQREPDPRASGAGPAPPVSPATP